jgi:ATP-binding protein involved in chromosome partitioning
MTDPREAVIGKRLLSADRIIGFFSAKGGVGKTVSTALAGCALAAQGRRVGILDLDLQGATTHIVLGAPTGMPAEDKGILPVRVRENLTLMSAAIFSGDRGLALRGAEVSDALRELLAVTIWGPLDYLLFDMPPGIGEEVLDCALLVPRIEAVIVSMPGVLSLSVVERLLGILRETRIAVPGMIATMTRGDASRVAALAGRAGVVFAGEVPYEPGLEEAIGYPDRLAATGAARSLARALAVMGIGNAV